jgi:tRNA(Arg) A34 adenosine deaminase TadA
VTLISGPAIVRLAGWRRRLLFGLPATSALAFLAPAVRAQIVAAERSAPIVQPERPDYAAFVERAMALRDEAIRRGDQPYGAIVVRRGAIVGAGVSAGVVARDPTAHAEMVAIRDAARRLDTVDLSGCILYGSSRACPMCEAAAYWARIARMHYGADGRDAGAPRMPA